MILDIMQQTTLNGIMEIVAAKGGRIQNGHITREHSPMIFSDDGEMIGYQYNPKFSFSLIAHTDFGIYHIQGTGVHNNIIVADITVIGD